MLSQLYMAVMAGLHHRALMYCSTRGAAVVELDPEEGKPAATVPPYHGAGESHRSMPEQCGFQGLLYQQLARLK